MGRSLSRPPKAGPPARFDPSVVRQLDPLLQPLKRWLSPVAFGLEHVPRSGAVLLVGNHTIYGLLDIPMLGLLVFEATGRVPRGLGDHIHFAVPLWRDLLRRLGAVDGNRENCAQLLRDGELVLVFPGGGREVMKHKAERYQLIWKERIGFVRLAIEHGTPIVPFASVGVEDMFDIVTDAEDLLRSPVGDLLRVLGIADQPWFRGGEVIPPLTRGRGPASIPRLERQYFLFGEPIATAHLAGRHEDRAACLDLRRVVQEAVEGQIRQLLEVRANDPERYPVQRLLRGLAARLG